MTFRVAAVSAFSAALYLLLSPAANAQREFTLIADTSASSPFSQFFGNASLNNAGVVAFNATLRGGGGNGIFVSNGDGITTIATTRVPPVDFLSIPSLNNAGMVAYRVGIGQPFTGQEGIFTGSGGDITTIANASGPFSPMFFGFPSLNDAGTVAFNATLRAGGQGIFTSSGGDITTVADTSGAFSSVGSPSLNDAGVVAFSTTLRAGGQGIFTSSGGDITTVADTSGAFSSVGSPSLNNAGVVAFRAVLDTGDQGLFTGPDPVADRVIGTGDALFGSTVTSLSFFREGLNDAGQVAFRATLADGRQVVARAVIPEPGTLALLVGAAVPGLGWAVRRRRPRR
jgi:hypothetical protein